MPFTIPTIYPIRAVTNKKDKIVLRFFVTKAITNIPRAKIGLLIKAKPRINPENMGKVDFNRSDLKYIINNTRENISDIPKIKIRFIAFDVRYINARYIKIFFLSNLNLLSRTAKYATSALRAINKYFNFSPNIM